MEENLTIRIAKVVSIDDEYDGQRIKAKILPEDRTLSNDKIPYAFPLLPKMMHIVPKVGEAVVVICANPSSTNSQRYYLGPIIHQPQFMNFDSYNVDATTLHNGSVGAPLNAPSRDPEAIGSFPKLNDIAVVGRKDTDLILSDNDVRLRCGVHLSDKNNDKVIKFNKTNPSYVKLKHHETPLNDKSQSTATIVSENINLISTASKQYFDTSDKDELITDEEMNKIIEQAHVLPYGDVLVDFLKMFIKAFKGHVHPYTGMPPVQDINCVNIYNYNLDDMLSDNIRIN